MRALTKRGVAFVAKHTRWTKTINIFRETRTMSRCAPSQRGVALPPFIARDDAARDALGEGRVVQARAPLRAVRTVREALRNRQ